MSPSQDSYVLMTSGSVLVLLKNTRNISPFWLWFYYYRNDNPC